MLEVFKKVSELLRGALQERSRSEEGFIREEKVKEALELLEALERDIMEKELKLAKEVLKEFDSNRKFYYLVGKLYVEVSKEEAEKLIEKELELFEKAKA
ncbi:prefoldin subunit [Aquifex pyrophilus]